MRRCAVYTRKSSEEGLDQRFNSLDAQYDACLAYIQSQAHDGWVEIDEKYDDGGFSGGTLDRPALQRLLAHIRARKVDVVVVHKVDRLTRSLMDFARLAELFEAHNVAFVSVTQHLNSADSLGRLSLNILLSFAQFERELASERIRDKILASRRRGLWTGGNPPLGYDCSNGNLVVNEAEARQVRHIFRRYLELASVADLRRDLGSAGIVSKVRQAPDGKARGGKALSRGTLYEMLRNPLYVGKIRCGSEIVEAQHEAIIDEQTWTATHNTLARTRADIGPPCRNTHQYVPLLTGKLFDGKGERLTHIYTVKKATRYHYYVSAASTRGESKAFLRIPCRLFDEEVARAIASALTKPQWLAASGLASALGKTQGCLPEPLGSDGDANKLRAESVQALLGAVTRLDVAEDRVTGALSYRRLFAVLSENSTDRFSAKDDSKQIPFSSPIVVRRSGRQMKTVMLGQRPAIERGKLILSDVERARTWYSSLCTGQYCSLAAIAAAENVSPSTISRRITLAFLSPMIEKSFRKGDLPKFVDREWLRRHCPLPADWQAQHQLIWGKTEHILS